MAWLGWCLVAAAMAVWYCGALGWVDELRQLFRSRGRGRDDDQGGGDLRQGGD
jgi:hypothetical protein